MVEDEWKGEEDGIETTAKEAASQSETFVRFRLANFSCYQSAG